MIDGIYTALAERCTRSMPGRRGNFMSVFSSENIRAYMGKKGLAEMY
jgi:hypothetical protein